LNFVEKFLFQEEFENLQEKSKGIVEENNRLVFNKCYLYLRI